MLRTFRSSELLRHFQIFAITHNDKGGLKTKRLILHSDDVNVGG